LKFRDVKVDLTEQLLVARHALFPGRHRHPHGIRRPESLLVVAALPNESG
jgi:hypothetical protein